MMLRTISSLGAAEERSREQRRPAGRPTASLGAGAAAALALVLTLAACGSGSDDSDAAYTIQREDVGLEATAEMSSPDGSPMGSVAFRQTPHGVLVLADVSNLAPGWHGFHIHSTGACTPDFGAAGGHFNPADTDHGLDYEGGFHAGDLPNLHSGNDTSAKAHYFTDGVTLASGANHSLFDDDGSAVVIHEKPDSYGQDPAAGDRISCGVITRN